MTLDVRDLRDPSAYGALFFQLREEHPEALATTIADYIDQSLDVPAYPKDYSTVKLTTTAYKAEIKERADAGDASARRLRREKGWDDDKAQDVGSDELDAQTLSASGMEQDRRGNDNKTWVDKQRHVE
jgi:hypothetical protein